MWNTSVLHAQIIVLCIKAVEDERHSYNSGPPECANEPSSQQGSLSHPQSDRMKPVGGWATGVLKQHTIDIVMCGPLAAPEHCPVH